MNNKAITFVKNFSYTLSSNLVSMLISTIVILVLPKLIGVEAYGYWQIYLFYTTYVGFLHFGWNDGIYLRYGGERYQDLNKRLFFSQFWMLIIFQLILGALVFLYSSIVHSDNKIFIFKATAVCMFLVNTRFFLMYVLQCTNRIKEYASINLLEKILYCLLIVLFLITGLRYFQLMVLADLAGKFVSLVYATYCCKEIVFRKINDFKLNFKETFENINIGIKLMFANTASLLILGVIRFGIEYSWGVKTFGKVSLSLSISNLTITLIAAVGVIMFPVLRRTERDKLPGIYKIFRMSLTYILLGSLIFYYPLNIVLLDWMPKYADSFKYLSIIFSLCVYEGRMELLVNTYLKTLRKEKLILFINAVSVIVSIVITFIVTLLLHNIILTVTSIVIIIAFRYTLAELFLFRLLHISLNNDIMLETILITIFILSGWFFTSFVGFITYTFVYIVYLLIKNKEIKLTFSQIKQLVTK